MSITQHAVRRGSVITPGLRAFAVGDALVSPPAYKQQTKSTSVLGYHSSSMLTWLRTMLPGLELEDQDIIGQAGTNTARLAAGIEEVVAARADYDLALVSVGLADSEETTRGVAPSSTEGVAAIERIVATLLRAAIKPVLLLPPPHPLFANGLFADRFIGVSATMRRLARQYPQIILVDPTNRIKRPDGFGIEPQPDLADTGGKLTIAGAFALAELVADALLAALPEAGLASSRDSGGEALLPIARGMRSGLLPSGCSLDASKAGGLVAKAMRSEQGGLRIKASGFYSSQWPLVRLHRTLPPSVFEGLVKGSEIGAEAEIRIRPTTQGLASVALQLTPVWQNDYIGLSSSEFFGRAQIGTGRIKLLRTPRFHLPGPLQRLSVSLLMHFLPGADLIADADVDVLSIALKRSDPPAPSDPA